MKVAVFLPNWVGDAVMATPVLRALRCDFPDAKIVGVMRPVIADVLAGSGLVDESLLYDPRGRVPERKGVAFLSRLRHERCDTALLLPNSLRSAWLAWCSGARRRIGFHRDGRGWLLTDRVPARLRNVPHPVIDDYLQLGYALGCRTLERKMSLAVSAEHRSQLETFLRRELPSAVGSGYVALNTGGAFGPAKNWPREYFVTLAQRITDELRKPVLLLCGPAERDDARWIVDQAQRTDVVSLADEPLSIGLTKAAVAACELLVTTDSGPRHFAAAFDRPVVTLFGPTHIAWSETYFAKSAHLQLPVDCGPCQQRECPLKHHRCMRELGVDSVFAAVQRLLAQMSRVAPSASRAA